MHHRGHALHKRYGRSKESKRRLAFAMLNSNFGSPAAQKTNWPDEERAAFSAATLIAGRVGGFKSALAYVKEWYAQGGGS